MNKKIILFDLDGTVIDSKAGIFNALYYTFHKLNMNVPDDATMCKFIGPSIGSSFITLFNFTQKDAENAVAIYREYYSTKGIMEFAVYDGIAELVIDLKAAGYHVGIATKKPEIYAKRIIESTGIAFDLVCGSDTSETHDSKSHIIKRCAEELTKSTEFSDVVMIGDTRYDIIGSIEAGVDSIGVLYGYGCRDEHIEHKATWIVDTVDDLHKLLLA